ncbi:FGGY-family carbohydrate kinase [Thiomonas delicata]|uniref:Carbohydrate kinase FGGY C-terminal domain-containing protein n=1 Tax=Thiomonas delicata TaxID=364030 RepID=A0A238D7X5_THIDL|nr:FGGY-family carbohydrate kinase [Thiomonas delicata]SBP89397.1 conserved hypothetical protein [Thiomonas delicata]
MKAGAALGLDFGTSGARACVIDHTEQVLFEAQVDFPRPREQSPHDWADALDTLLGALPADLRSRLAFCAVDATSGTVLLTDAGLRPVGPALAYFDARAHALALELERSLPRPLQLDALARLLWLWREHGGPRVVHAMHQADWITARLLGRAPPTDWHNALKTGADAASASWPDAVRALPPGALLPAIVAPGTELGRVGRAAARRFDLPPALVLRAGTTDGNAGFIATGATRPGQAVTTLGSTLSLKLLSSTRVDAPEYGVYSHRFGPLWLASGASNAGGAVLRQLFTDARLQELSSRIDAETDSPLDLYPLPAPGERFPVRDPLLLPRLQPRPADDAAYLHGLLQALAGIEAAGYRKLAELGATPAAAVFTTGGGARNPAWTRLRERALGLPVHLVPHTQAAFGAARLALRGTRLLPSPDPGAFHGD